MKFTAELQLHGKTATGIEIPPEVLATLGGGKRPPLTVTLNGYTYDITPGVMGGRTLISVSADFRQKAGVAAGQIVDVELRVRAKIPLPKAP
ncbi:MAG: DUF1905 domain-containing protein [Chloroflexi bacterium]|nr:DUF1905 domain-containing protein [Chloroflexota bacterium]